MTRQQLDRIYAVAVSEMIEESTLYMLEWPKAEKEESYRLVLNLEGMLKIYKKLIEGIDAEKACAKVSERGCCKAVKDEQERKEGKK